MDTDCLIVHVKTEDIYIDNAENVETRCGTSNFELDRSLPNGKTKKVIGLMEDELGVQIMKELVGLKAKTYSSLKKSNDKDKKGKGTKKFIIKRKFKFEDNKNCLEKAEIENKINHVEKK